MTEQQIPVDLTKARNMQDLPRSIRAGHSVAQAMWVALNLVQNAPSMEKIDTIQAGREAIQKKSKRPTARAYTSNRTVGRPANLPRRTAVVLLLWLMIYQGRWTTYADAANIINRKVLRKKNITKPWWGPLGARIGENGKPLPVSKDSLGRALRDIACAFGRDHEGDRLVDRANGVLTSMPQVGDLVELFGPMLTHTIKQAGHDPRNLSIALDGTGWEANTTMVAGKQDRAVDSEGSHIWVNDEDSKPIYKTPTPRHPEDIILGSDLQLGVVASKLGEGQCPQLVATADLSADEAGTFGPGGRLEKFPGGPGHAVLERGRENGLGYAEVIVDRGYSPSSTFRRAVFSMGAVMVASFKLEDARKFSYAKDCKAILKAGALYATCTPRDLLEAPHPDSVDKNDPVEVARVQAMWDELDLYRMEPNGRPKRTKNGKITQRFRGPALAGRVERLTYRSPKLAKYTEHALCQSDHGPGEGCEASITVHAETLADLQRHRYMTEEHKASFARRSTVEATNNRVKDEMPPARLRTRTAGRKRLLILAYLVARNVRVARIFHLERLAQDPWAEAVPSLAVVFPPGMRRVRLREEEMARHRRVFGPKTSVKSL